LAALARASAKLAEFELRLTAFTGVQE